RISPDAGSSGPLALDKLGGVDPEPPHACPDLGPFLLEEARPLGFAKARPSARRDEHADPALHDDQPFVLETLVSLGDGERIRLLLSGKRADGGQWVAVAIFAGEDRVGDDFAEADVDGFFVLGAQRHAVIIHRRAESAMLLCRRVPGPYDL